MTNIESIAIDPKMDAIIAQLSKDLVSYNNHFNTGAHQAAVSTLYPDAPYVKGEGWVLDNENKKPKTERAFEEIARAPELSTQVSLGRKSEISKEPERDVEPMKAAEKIIAQHTLDLDKNFGEFCKKPKSANEALVVQAAHTLLPPEEFESMKHDGSNVGMAMTSLNKALVKQSAIEIGKQSLRKYSQEHAHDHDHKAPHNMLGDKTGFLEALHDNLLKMHHSLKGAELGNLKAPSTPSESIPEKAQVLGRVK